MVYTLDEKLTRIRSGKYKSSDFIIADAKDGDMGAGVTCSGFTTATIDAPARRRTRLEFIKAIREVIDQGVVDIMLTSVSNLELLNEQKAFKGSKVKPAFRANDATDIWGGIRHGNYAKDPSMPFRTASPSIVMKGKAKLGTDLGLYSLTFTNDTELDAYSQDAFAAFREDARENGLKYFYEVFNPNVDIGLDQKQTGEFVNDNIIRSLAGLTKAERPEFLKIVYNGAGPLEELASFDPSLVVGVLGGGAGTARDTFELLSQAERYGARVALFGRKINLAESPLDLLLLMREVASGNLTPLEAVKSYHATLAKKKLIAIRSLEHDSTITESVLKAAAK